jgi:putrescine transport system permease protein
VITAARTAARAEPGRLGPLWTFLFRYGPPRWTEYVLNNWVGQRLVIAVPYLWLLIFFLVPFLIVLKISFAESDLLGRPPYEPMARWFAEEGMVRIQLVVDSYKFLFSETLYVSAWINSIKVAAVATFFTLLLGYPMAYAIARSSPTSRNVLLMLIILPFWTSFLLRVYAWIGLLKTDGVINNLLMGIGIIDAPLTMMYTNFAVYVGIVYSYLPFMILPLFTNLEKHDLTLLEAAQDLGAGPVKSFLRITLPLSFPGIVAGSMLVFIPVVGEYVIPSLLGSKDQLMIAPLLWTEFYNNRNWPNASAMAIAMLLLLVVPIMIFQRFQNKELRSQKR